MRLTGSGFGRAEKCPPSTFLPGVEEPPSIYAKLGSAVHRYLCLVAEVGREAALELIESDYRAVCEALDVEGLPHSTPDAWAVEVAYAWDHAADTARELYRGSGARTYGDLAPTEKAGTADLVGLDGDMAIVLDLKVGWKPLGPPKKSLQLGFYAVAAARAMGATRALVGFVRLNEDVPRYEYAVLDEFELEAMAERLKNVITSAEWAEVDYQTTGELKLVSGDHCQHCPAFLRCPAKATLLREMVLHAEQNDPAQLVPVLDAENIPQVLERLWAVKDIFKRVEKTLEEYATTNPVHLSDGKVYGAVEQTSETFDPAVGGKVIADIYGAETADACVEIEEKLTKANMERVLKPLLKERGEKWAPNERELHKAIRDAGGAKTSVWTTVKVFKPKLLP